MRSVRIVIFLLFVALPAWGANIYVDQGAAEAGSDWDGVDGHSYTGSPGVGTGYSTIQAAINAMSHGDHIYMRGGTYQPTPQTVELINIPTSKNGSSWSTDYNYLGSYPGEWAIIDGQNNAGNRGVGIGHYAADHSTASDICYWQFERFEIKNCRSSGGQFSWGLFGNGGPFKARYLYIHSNQATTAANNPFGLGGYHWKDSLVEYCYFSDNGIASPNSDTNPAHIGVFSDYNWADISVNGFDPSDTTNSYIARNEYRYNYFLNGSVGIKHKGGQYYTGRTSGSPHSDTYSTYGDKVHHNIFIGGSSNAIEMNQDFAQVYNNIVDGVGGTGICSHYENTAYYYKPSFYNNTVIGSMRGGIVFYAYLGSTETITNYLAYDYNNIIDNIASYSGYCTYIDDNVCSAAGTPFNLSNFYTSNNYFYRPQRSDLYSLNRTGYTQAEFEAQTATHIPRVAYTNAYDAGNTLYTGATGANKYIPRSSGAHVIEGSTTIANGGIGGNHPYLSGVTIPSYVGAVNPSDSDWVAGVLSLATYTNLRDATAGSDPTWIEGSGSSPSTPTITGVMTGSIR